MINNYYIIKYDHCIAIGPFFEIAYNRTLIIMAIP